MARNRCAGLRLTVTDINEAPTSAAITGGVIDENLANGSFVGRVTGTDADAGAVLSYGFARAATAAAGF